LSFAFLSYSNKTIDHTTTPARLNSMLVRILPATHESDNFLHALGLFNLAILLFLGPTQVAHPLFPLSSAALRAFV